MSPSPEIPDTTEAVSWAETFEHGRLGYDIARTAIAADRKALAEAGYAIVKVGEVPPWMREADNVYIRLDRPDNPLIDGQYLLVGQVYVITTDEIEA